jgi:hypothetical protein
MLHCWDIPWWSYDDYDHGFFPRGSNNHGRRCRNWSFRNLGSKWWSHDYDRR